LKGGKDIVADGKGRIANDAVFSIFDIDKLINRQE